MNERAATTQVFRHGRPILCAMLAACVGAAGCGGGGAGSTSTGTGTAAVATTPTNAIPPSALVAPTGTLKGFSASGAPQTATTAKRWAEISNQPDELSAETARLAREGFREGVGQHYKAAGGPAALSLVLVFESAEGAKQEVKHYLQADPRYGLHLEEGVTVAAIPGSLVVGEGPAGNVLFTTGDCFLLVGDDLGGSASQAQVNAVPIAAAAVLYGRVKRVCA
jgi:hypothetical protein